MKSSFRKVAKLVVVMLFILSPAAYSLPEQEISFQLGIQSTNVGGELGAKTGHSISYGAIDKIEISSPSYIRVGALISNRSFEAQGLSSSGEFDAHFLEVPLQYQYEVRSMWGLFGGARLGVLLSDGDECEINSRPCAGSEFKSTFSALEVGTNYKINENFAFEGSYIHGLSEIAEGVDLENGFSLSAAYIF